MLDAKKDRIDYSEILMPPEDFYLAKAIATTYTLDLFTLLSIPVSLFFGREPKEPSVPTDSVEILEAIQKMDGVVDVFCQKGKIKIPDKFNKLFAFLENSVHEIPLENARSSFHPKVWILRYNHNEKKEARYRLIVLSRNLTFDRSWDLAFYTEGAVGRKGKQNPKLIDYLAFLSEKSSFEIDKTFIEGLKKVQFDECPASVSEMIFHPILGNNKKYSNPLADMKSDKLLIVSPFLDAKTLRSFAEQANEKYLFSRKEELDKIEPSILEDYQVYYLNPNIVSGEDTIQADGSQLQNLHAKFYAFESRQGYQLFLGSANCTSPAFGRNVEFLVSLKSRKKEFSVEYLRDELINEGKLPNEELKTTHFLKYDCTVKEEPSVENKIKDLRELEYELQKAFFRGKYTENSKGTFDLDLYYDLGNCYLDSEYQFFIRPIGFVTKKMLGQEKNHLTFSNIGLKSLTTFFVVEVEKKKESVLQMALKLPIKMPEGRIDSVFKTLVDSKEKFFQYLSFLFEDRESVSTNSLLEGHLFSNSLTESDKRQLFYGMPIFEQLLLAASSNKQKLKSIDKLLERLGIDDERVGKDSEIVPQDFLELWEVFKEFINE